MQEIRLVGRGGQGVVTAGELLGGAAVHEGKHAQAIPTFGPERRGALAQCTVRLDDHEILLKYSASQPHVLVVLDPTIWRAANVMLGLREDATLIFNTAEPPGAIERALAEPTLPSQLPVERCTIHTVDATGIALEVLGRPITNTAMLGAVAAITGAVQMESLETVFGARFGERAAVNVEAARVAAQRICNPATHTASTGLAAGV